MCVGLLATSKSCRAFPHNRRSDARKSTRTDVRNLTWDHHQLVMAAVWAKHAKPTTPHSAHASQTSSLAAQLPAPTTVRRHEALNLAVSSCRTRAHVEPSRKNSPIATGMCHRQPAYRLSCVVSNRSARDNGHRPWRLWIPCPAHSGLLCQDIPKHGICNRHGRSALQHAPVEHSVHGSVVVLPLTGQGSGDRKKATHAGTAAVRKACLQGCAVLQ